MSRSNWGDRAILVLTAGAAFLFMLVVIGAIVSQQYVKVHQTYAEYQKNADQDRRKAANEIQRACIGTPPPNFAKCIIDNIESYDRKQATNQDLQAQQNMALWAFWAVIVGGFGVGVTGIGIFYVRQTLEANRAAVSVAAHAAKASEEAVGVAQDTAKRELRAYIAHKPGGIKFIDQAGNWMLKYMEHNVGQTPAHDVRFYYNIITDTEEPPSSFEDGLRYLQILPYVPPNQTIDPILPGTAVLFNKHFFLYGRIDYRDIFGHWHRRRFALSFYRMREGEDLARWHHEHNDDQPLDEAPPIDRRS